MSFDLDPGNLCNQWYCCWENTEKIQQVPLTSRNQNWHNFPQRLHRSCPEHIELIQVLHEQKRRERLKLQRDTECVFMKIPLSPIREWKIHDFPFHPCDKIKFNSSRFVSIKFGRGLADFTLAMIKWVSRIANQSVRAQEVAIWRKHHRRHTAMTTFPRHRRWL